MRQYAFLVDTDKCINCKACAVACKEKQNLKLGYKYRKIYSNSAGSWSLDGDGVCTPSNVFSYALSVACNHCVKPACLSVCPAGAIGKRSDGIVFIDKSLCIGCGTCASACPYSAPSLDRAAMKAGKCDFCREYIDAGEPPVCVAACSMRALSYGEFDQLKSMHPEAVQQVAPLPSPSQTNPSLLVIPHSKYQSGMTVIQYNMPEEIQAAEA